MLGNEHDAKFIRDWHFAEIREWQSAETPPGFLLIGSGCARVAYLHKKTNVVYKVEKRYNSGRLQSNEAEYNYLRSQILRKAPKGIRFPRYSLHRLDGRCVSALEYLPLLLRDFDVNTEEGSRYWDLRYRLVDFLPDLFDLHGQNIAVDADSGQIVPIDLGC
jgi:hypothetical protein